EVTAEKAQGRIVVENADVGWFGPYLAEGRFPLVRHLAAHVDEKGLRVFPRRLARIRLGNERDQRESVKSLVRVVDVAHGDREQVPVPRLALFPGQRLPFVSGLGAQE